MYKSHLVRIKCLASDNNARRNDIALVPAGLLRNISHPLEGEIKFGLKSAKVSLIPRAMYNTVVISKNVLEQLNIPEGIEIHGKFQKNTLSLGPVVGFITSPGTIRRMLRGYPNHKIVQTMEAAKTVHAFLYFFCINDILWDENSVNGVMYNQSKDIWEDKKMPLPDIIYDRGLASGLSARGWRRALRIRDRLSQLPGIKKINAQHYFDKWDLHYRLSKHEEMKKYLPDTVLYRNDINDLESMMDKYKTLYIKACIGSNGRSVMRVRNTGSSEYEYDHFRGKLIRKTVESLQEVLEAAKNFMGSRDFIIQQGIDAFTYKDNKVDIRVLVQRNGTGQWQITSMPVRIAANNSPVTSTKSGSTVYKFDDAFKNVLGFTAEQVQTLKKDVFKLIQTAVDTIEEEYGPFAELGIDVAIDKDLNVWFLEANSKPAKDTIIKSGSQQDVERAFLPPFQYARYITGFAE